MRVKTLAFSLEHIHMTCIVIKIRLLKLAVINEPFCWCFHPNSTLPALNLKLY